MKGLWSLFLLSFAVVLAAAPLEPVWQEPFRPACRPGAKFSGRGTDVLTVKLDEKTGCFGRWSVIYDLPKDAKACRFTVRHDAERSALDKGLIVCRAVWRDRNGKDLRCAYLEVASPDTFTRTLKRPAGAEQVELTGGVRDYYGKTVAFRDFTCEPVDFPPRKVRIAVAKITPASGGRATCADNTARMESVFVQLEKNGEKPDLVVFPETLLTRWVRGLGVGKGAQPIPGPHTDWAAAWARKLHTNVVVSLREIADGRYYNSAAVIDRSGKIVGVYRKTQLCVGEYEGGYQWGGDLPVFSLDFGKIGVLICWDMWFPEAIRTLRLRGAEVIAYPIAAPSRQHYDTMWRARAQENGIVLAASISGGDGACPSRIITPDGEVMAETYRQQTYAATTVDLNDLPVNMQYLSVDSGEGETRSFYIYERHPALYRDLTDYPR